MVTLCTLNLFYSLSLILPIWTENDSGSCAVFSTAETATNCSGSLGAEEPSADRCSLWHALLVDVCSRQCSVDHANGENMSLLPIYGGMYLSSVVIVHDVHHCRRGCLASAPRHSRHVLFEACTLWPTGLENECNIHSAYLLLDLMRVYHAGRHLQRPF